MTLEQQQRAFDDVKWFDSIQAGEDKCGSYEFCAQCVKTMKYPCARAAKKQSTGGVRIAVTRKRKRIGNL